MKIMETFIKVNMLSDKKILDNLLSDKDYHIRKLAEERLEELNGIFDLSEV